MTDQLVDSSCHTLIALALQEDLGMDQPTPDADLTARLTVPADRLDQGVILAKSPGVIAGLPVARAVFNQLDADLDFVSLVEDGASVSAGDHVVHLQGPTRSLLAAERTALNFLQRLSGVATLTNTYVQAVAGTKVCIVDTRKTTPGYRHLEKYAVLQGGGTNHRLGLFDAILIKENHAAAAGGVDQAVALARSQAAAAIPVYVEARTLEEVAALIPLGPDRIMLDNMNLQQLTQAVHQVRRQDANIQLEATGGVNLDTVRSIALTGVDLISVGALTHSAPALDLSLLLTEVK